MTDLLLQMLERIQKLEQPQGKQQEGPAFIRTEGFGYYETSMQLEQPQQEKPETQDAYNDYVEVEHTFYKNGTLYARLKK